MLKIALCDDEIKQHDTINKLMFEYFDNNFSLKTYTDAQLLLNHIEWGGKNLYDLYILDVLMPKMSGIELGYKLRLMGVEAPIIYLSNSKDYAVDSYNVHAFYYLVKPIKKDTFFSVLSQTETAINETKLNSITINTSDGPVVIKNSDILYAELYSRSVRYYLTNGTIIDSKKLRASFRETVSNLLEKENFTLLGSSFLVNLHHVKKINKSDLFLTNGKALPLPRNSRNNLLETWMNYWIDDKTAE